MTDDYSQDRSFPSLIIPLSHRVTLEAYIHRVTEVGKDLQDPPVQPVRPSQPQDMAVLGYSCSRRLFLLLQGHYFFFPPDFEWLCLLPVILLYTPTFDHQNHLHRTPMFCSILSAYCSADLCLIERQATSGWRGLLEVSNPTSCSRQGQH